MSDVDPPANDEDVQEKRTIACVCGRRIHMLFHLTCGRCGETAVRCTGLAATYCPVHGDCTCERREDGEVMFSGLSGCPLHAIDSDHAIAPDDECPHCNGTGKVPVTGGGEG